MRNTRVELGFEEVLENLNRLDSVLKGLFVSQTDVDLPGAVSADY